MGGMIMDIEKMFSIVKQINSSAISPQETKGEKCYYDCYGSDYAKVCEQLTCLWRDSCLELASEKNTATGKYHQVNSQPE